MDKKQFFKLYNKLPEEVQDLLTSSELGDDLETICDKYDIVSNFSSLFDYVGDVLLGLLPPDEFQETIQKELGLNKDKAKKITREINRFVFYPVKSSLEDLYNMEIAPIAKMKVKLPANQQEKKKIKKEATKADTYREPIDL